MQMPHHHWALPPLLPQHPGTRQDGDHIRAYVLQLNASGFDELLLILGIEVKWVDDTVLGAD